jgi:CRP-like cAMP-binding protein
MIVSGFLMTDMLQLRLVLAAGYTNLVIFHSLHPRPLRIPLGWSAMFVLVNASYAALLLMDQYAPGDLTAADTALYEQSFKEALTMGQFYQLLKLAVRQTVPCGTILSEEGQPCDKLYFIEKGSARLYHQNTRTAVIEQGGFINDVAFSRGLSIGAYGTAVTDGSVGGISREEDDNENNDDNYNDGTASATSSSSSATSTTTLLVWDARELKEYLKQRPAMDRNMKYLLSEHLVKSLLRQRDGTRERTAAAVSIAQQQQQQLQQQVQHQRPSYYWTWWGRSAKSGPAPE